MQNIATHQQTTDKPLWAPNAQQIAASALTRFMAAAGVAGDYRAMWRWSVDYKEEFWARLWDSCGVIGDRGMAVFTPGEKFQDARFFTDAKINFAENLLKNRSTDTAIFFRGEHKVEREISFGELYDTVSRIRQALIQAGVKKGDRVAGYLPNLPETVMIMLAVTSLGAIWSSASPDFGVQGLLDRFGQIEPKIFFGVDGYFYYGKEIDCRAKVKEAAAQLPSVQKTVVVQYMGYDVENAFDDFIAPYTPVDISFERFDFNHPLYIMFSSGTTGVPKCIVHGAGGTLLQHLKEHQLQCDVRHGDRVFYFTTCGWMMWNWLVSGLASGASLMLYDGAPFAQRGQVLFDFAAKHGCTLFGTSAKYIDALRGSNIRAAGKPGLESVRMVTSTGSPLSHESFDYVYDALFPAAHLASISGGTDIVSCFVLGNPASPVYRGEIQGPGLGMDVDVLDDAGQPMKTGKGELVCKTPFPSMPVGFWNDPDGVKYSKAYFERFPNIWCHGDWCEWTAHGGLIIHGRSDATLNPGGVRIGTAEIYRIVDQLPGIKESIAIGQDWDGDVRVILFVVMQDGASLDDALIATIKRDLKDKASPRHVPAKIIPVPDIPRTKSGKMTELAVREIIHGQPVKNVEALANPDALAHFKDLPELKS